MDYAKKLELNTELQHKVKLMIDHLTPLCGTDFADPHFKDEHLKPILYQDCKSIIEHLDIEHCLKTQ